MNKGFVVAGLVLLIVGASLDVSLTGIRSSALSETVLSVEPETKNVGLDQTFTVSIQIANANNLIRWLFSISWNNTVVRLNPESSDALVEGSFLKNVGPTVFYRPACRPGISRISSVSCEFSPPSRVTGNGVLMTIGFKAIGNGQSNVTICDAFLDTSQGKVTPTCRNGLVVVGSNSQLPVHDLEAVLDVPRDIYVNAETAVTAILRNVGTVSETNCTITMAISESTLIVRSATVDLPARGSYNLTYLWRPSFEGTYAVLVRADPVSGEVMLDNNSNSTSINVTSRRHDISIELDCSNSSIHCVSDPIDPGVTVTNKGAFNETVSVYLTIKGPDVELSSNWTLTSLAPSLSNLTIFPWTPTVGGRYNISALARLETGNANITECSQMKTIEVKEAKTGITEILIVADTGGFYYSYGTSLEGFKSALTDADLNYDIWFQCYNSPNGSLINASMLRGYKIVVWTCGDYRDYVIDPYYDAPAITEYVQEGGNLLLEGEGVISSMVARKVTLPGDVFGVDLRKTAIAAAGIEPVPLQISRRHMIIQNLNYGVNWVRSPTFGPDGVVSVGKGFEVVRYPGTEFAAVAVVDGSETGAGSAVCFTFPLFSIPQEYRDMLVNNTISWFNRFGVSTVVSAVLNAPSNTVRFVYGSLEERKEVEFDIAAGSMLSAVSKNEQVQGFCDSTNESVLSGNVVCLFGSVSNHTIIHDYNARGEMPILAWQDPDHPDHYLLKNRTGILVYDLYVNPTNSTFVVLTFKDTEKSITFLVVYSFDWKGMWAAGTYLTRIISKSLRDYCGAYYVFSWNDLNGNSIPELEQQAEVTLVASG